jgi:hypothetical protein
MSNRSGACHEELVELMWIKGLILTMFHSENITGTVILVKSKNIGCWELCKEYHRIMFKNASQLTPALRTQLVKKGSTHLLKLKST